jgi:UDP-N-acetyl-2-amino-2-deoxyglucuronate dehydrogenase
MYGKVPIMKKYNVGIIGYGWVATAHIPAINASRQAQVTAVCSSRPQDDAALSEKHGGTIRSYTDLDQMLADPDIHIVSICSFSGLHAEHAIKAAKAGKHLIIEKPIALSWEDCQRVAEAVAAAGVKVCVCFECRFSSQLIATRAVIDQGLLGELHYGEVDYFHGIGPWYGQFEWNAKRTGGGSALLTAGCHALDALLLCMGEDVQSVSSYSTKTKSPVFEPYEYDTTSVTILRFADGRVGKCSAVVDCLQPYYFHTQFCGSEGSLLDDKFHSMKLKTDKSAWSKLSFKGLDSGDVTDHPYQTQFQAFFDAIDEGQDMPLTDLKTALHTHRIIFAADESARTGLPVDL